VQNEKSNGASVLRWKLEDSGVPIAKSSLKNMQADGVKFNWKTVSAFVKGKESVAVVGKGCCQIGANMMKYRLIERMDLNPLWISQSALERDMDISVINLLAICSLHKESSSYRSDIVGSIVTRFIAERKQILLLSPSEADLEDAFPYDLEMMSEYFNIMEVTGYGIH
jgi:hypothetical protein